MLCVDPYLPMHYLSSVINFPPNYSTSVVGQGNRLGLGTYLPGYKDVFDALIGPIGEFVSRDSKQVRAQLVKIGFDLSRKDISDEGTRSWDHDSLIECLGCVVEALHAGSLVIDDIQDGSDFRRGAPALHRQIGIPLAINAANWLYFWPADLIRQQGLPAAVELEIYRLFHTTMLRAHRGQALDLGHDMTEVPQEQARNISLSTIELKTGELMGMCTELGAIAGEANPETRKSLTKFGRRFGIALQMFNDIGEIVFTATDPAPLEFAKSFRRPSWVWAVAAQELDSFEYGKFQMMMRDPHTLADRATLARHPSVEKSVELACAEIESIVSFVAELADTQECHARVTAITALVELARKVMNVYA